MEKYCVCNCDGRCDCEQWVIILESVATEEKKEKQESGESKKNSRKEQK